MDMKGKDKEGDDSRHGEGSPVAAGKRKRPLLYEGPIASILNALFIRTRLDFPPEAFHRIKGGTKEKPIQFTPSQIVIRHRILNEMLAASSMRDKEVAEVVLNTSEMLLVQEEFKETVDESGVVMLLEYYDYAQHLQVEHQCTADAAAAAAAALGPNAAGLKRADCIMLVGGISMIHVSSITKGFNVTVKHGSSRIVLLSFDAEDANLQRQEIMKRAASKGYTYSIRVQHDRNPDAAKAFAETEQ
jgi:hypothetical protein